MIPLAVLAAAVLFFLAAASGVFSSSKASSKSATTTPATTAPAIAGIQCNFSEQVTYHEHAHLTVLDRGKPVAFPAGIGINVDHDCLYWLHTHNPDGIIHIEAPHKIVPALADFFAVWHKPLNSKHVGPLAVPPGAKVKVYVNMKLYNGPLGAVKLHRHTDITVEVGPPFKPPKKYNFTGGL